VVERARFGRWTSCHELQLGASSLRGIRKHSGQEVPFEDICRSRVRSRQACGWKSLSAMFLVGISRGRDSAKLSTHKWEASVRIVIP
jgi:hypothetical protein